jgi:RHS repeat-associated protein
VDGAVSTSTLDAINRSTAISNVLGSFNYGYDGNSTRLTSATCPNGQVSIMNYGDNLQDNALLQIVNTVNAGSISEFGYMWNVPRGQMTTCLQQAASQTPSVFNFGSDAANQLVSALVTNSGILANTFGYSYDLAGNRLTETMGGSTSTATYNALNQISTTDDPGAVARTNQWDAQNRLVATSVGNQTTQFGYDGANHVAYIRQLQNGSQVSLRYFAWSGNRICEERDASATNITKRFYPQGVLLETGTNAGAYYYTRDYLGSVHELTDAAGNVRARYSYDPFGRQTKVSGDVDTDFGFAGMFWSSEASLDLTQFRAYDPQSGRWLSRDPLLAAEMRQGPNLYSYVGNQPLIQIDLDGRIFPPNTVTATCARFPQVCLAMTSMLTYGAAQMQRAQQAGQQALNSFQACAADIANDVNALVARAPQAYQALQNYFNAVDDNPGAFVTEGDMMRLGTDYVSSSGQQLWAQLYSIPPSIYMDFEEDLDLLVQRISQWTGMPPNEVKELLEAMTYQNSGQ